MELHVTPKEFSRLREWSLLPEPEFRGKVYFRYPWLREVPCREQVRVIVDWQRPRLNRWLRNSERVGSIPV